MIYDIEHLTAYSYKSPVRSTTLALRLTPRSELSQRKLAHRIEILPEPDRVTSQCDFFGNAVDLVTIDTRHTELSIRSTARVETAREPLDKSGDLAWERARDAALACRDLTAGAPCHFLFASPRIAFRGEITQYVAESFPNGRGILEACSELIARIRADFAYRPKSTEVRTSIGQAFRQRSGVCQDFAQIMIGGLRGLGVPAAYVSGYLRTLPPPGKARLQGADATHAWVSVWAGPERGWVGFDPTNAMPAGNDHVSLAVGRDFSDVSPVYGVFVGSGKNKLKVEVDVVPVPSGAAR